jgi:hypothetical protein
MDVTCDLLCWITTILACMLVGLKSLVILLDYRSYMGSSARIWSLRWLFLYLCSYNLDGSVTSIAHPSFIWMPCRLLERRCSKRWEQIQRLQYTYEDSWNTWNMLIKYLKNTPETCLKTIATHMQHLNKTCNIYVKHMQHADKHNCNMRPENADEAYL